MNLKLLDYLGNTAEGPYFDRKSSRIAPKDIIRHIIAFANANGGSLAIGVEGDGEFTGFGMQRSHSPDEYKEEILKSCYPLPSFNFEKVAYGSKDTDYILLIRVEASSNQVIMKMPEKTVYFRVSDKSMALNHDQITKLEYDKGQRFFEEQEIKDATIEEDIDYDIVRMYCEKMDVTGDINVKATLNARGLIRNRHLTNAAILLFGKNPTKFLPQARVRFIRYDGMKPLTGERINISKEKVFDAAIPVILLQIADFIRAQLREFQFLASNGQFKRIPEYPEFAWFEGIVNALTHRDYSVSGDHIRVSMYDDRMEIFSPGKLPNIVTLKNMKYTRFSRNPRIARILTEFGWVKELNEGVNRIYDEMQSFFLKSPQYSEPNNQAVRLILENSITSRNIRASDQLSTLFAKEWVTLSDEERVILQYLYCNDKVKVRDLADFLGKSVVYARKVLKELTARGLAEWKGSSVKDPHQYYTIPRQYGKIK